MDMRLSKVWEIVKDGETRCAGIIGSQRVRQDLATEQQQMTAAISTLQFYIGNYMNDVCHISNRETQCLMHEKWKWSCSVMSDSLQPHGLYLPGSSIHGIFQARLLEWVAISFSMGSNPGLLNCRQILYHLNHKGSILLITLSYAWKLCLYKTKKCGKFWKRWAYQTTWPASWETCMQVRKQQLKLDMEQQTGSQ